MSRAVVTAFDLDGTLLEGQSGTLILIYLMKRGYLRPQTVAAAAWWGIRYKFHLALRQETVRELIFNDIGKLSPERVERIMDEFHDEVMVPRYRKAGVEQLRRHVAAGEHVVLVSATFDQVGQAAARYLGAQTALATFMEKDARGNYTGRVDGEVTAGPEKLRRLDEWANRSFGPDGWELRYAYSDHYSDLPLLERAEHAFAVNPGPTLRREAPARGWPILDWK